MAGNGSVLKKMASADNSVSDCVYNTYGLEIGNGGPPVPPVMTRQNRHLNKRIFGASATGSVTHWPSGAALVWSGPREFGVPEASGGPCRRLLISPAHACDGEASARLPGAVDPAHLPGYLIAGCWIQEQIVPRGPTDTGALRDPATTDCLAPPATELRRFRHLT
jgi:hypothetical protein